jgi:uncharacterized membrane protein YfcA
VAALRGVPQERRLKIIARELVIALIILLVFLFGGPWLLGLLHLKQEALFISGGVVLFFIALKMIFPPLRRDTEEQEMEPLIVPLADGAAHCLGHHGGRAAVCTCHRARAEGKGLHGRGAADGHVARDGRRADAAQRH